MYRLREGMVLTNVCGTPLLVATRKLWEEKLPIRRIPKGVALTIEMLNKGISAQSALNFISFLNKEHDKTLINKKLTLELEKLCQEGYLTKTEN